MDSSCKQKHECSPDHRCSLNRSLLKLEPMAGNVKAHFTNPGECQSYHCPKTTTTRSDLNSFQVQNVSGHILTCSHPHSLECHRQWGEMMNRWAVGRCPKSMPQQMLRHIIKCDQLRHADDPPEGKKRDWRPQRCQRCY